MEALPCISGSGNSGMCCWRWHSARAPPASPMTPTPYTVIATRATGAATRYAPCPTPGIPRGHPPMCRSGTSPARPHGPSSCSGRTGRPPLPLRSGRSDPGRGRGQNDGSGATRRRGPPKCVNGVTGATTDLPRRRAESGSTPVRSRPTSVRRRASSAPIAASLVQTGAVPRVPYSDPFAAGRSPKQQKAAADICGGFRSFSGAQTSGCARSTRRAKKLAPIGAASSLKS